MQSLMLTKFAQGRAQISSVSPRALQAALLHARLDLPLSSTQSSSHSLPHVRQLATGSNQDRPVPQHHVLDFIENFDLSNISSSSGTVDRAKSFLVDAIGVIIAGTQTPCSSKAYTFAKSTAGGVGSTGLWMDGNRASAPAVAMAHALTCDSVDMTDGLEVAQGHCGVVVVPSAFAFARTKGITVSGKELLEAIIVGYEVGLRAGKKLRDLENKLDEKVQHPKPEEWYELCESSSGAWNALGSAAASTRLLRLSKRKIKEALGIAEYYGPRSMMMRCIAEPTMLKDGAGMGAYAGTSAAILAQLGFTGASAETVDDSELWKSIGNMFVLNDQYYKKFAVCYWSQCAMQGALDCLEGLGLNPSVETANRVESVKISTFRKAVSMNHPHPSTTEIAQYSLEFAVAAVIRYGHVGASEVINLDDHTVSSLSGKVKTEEKLQYTRKYPHERLADVEVVMTDGSSYKVEGVMPPWTNRDLPSEDEVKEKFFTNVTDIVSFARAHYLYRQIQKLETLTPDEVGQLLDVLEAGH